MRNMLGYTGSYTDSVPPGYPLGNGYRWYLPSLMRFNASDNFSPFGAGGPHPYSYCSGDPINRTDPTGHMVNPDEFLEEAETIAITTQETTQTTTSTATSSAPIAVAEASGTSTAYKRSGENYPEGEPVSKAARSSSPPTVSQKPIIPENIREDIRRIRETSRELNQPSAQQGRDTRALERILRQSRNRVNAYFDGTWTREIWWQWDDQDRTVRYAFEVETESLFLQSSNVGTPFKERLIANRSGRWLELHHRSSSVPPPDLEEGLNNGAFLNTIAERDWVGAYVDVGLPLPFWLDVD